MAASRISTWTEITSPAGTEEFAVDDGTDNKKISLDTVAEYSFTHAPYGSLYWSSTAATTLSAATPALAAGTTTAMQVSDMTASATNRLTYDGTPTTMFFVEFTGSVSKTSGGATTGSFFIYKNGSLVTGSTIQRSLANTSDTGAFAISCMVSLATNDYVELWVETTNGDNLTIENGVLAAAPV